MITTSATYNTIFADPSHYAESKIVVGATTYDESVIMSLERSQSLYADYYDIGGCVMNQITFTLLGVTAAQLPKMSRVEVWTRIKNATLTSEWLPMGVYYTAKPEYDTEAQLLTVTGYDEMYKANVVPFAQGSQITSWDDPNLRQVAQHLADGTAVTDVIDSNFGGIGVALEDPTQISDAITMPSIPYNYTAREILGEIAVACCGNWVVVFQESSGSQVAKLRLVTMASMQGAVQHTLGRNVTGFTKGDPIIGVTNARVYYGYDSNGVALYESAVASPDDGREYDVELKTFTDSTQAQAIAQSILSGLSTSLPPYTADGSEIDPACELGDTVSVNSVTSSLGAITTVFNQGMWADISSPSIPTDDEFGYESGVQRAVDRAERTSEVNKAKIEVNADSIQAEVERATTAESDMNESLRSSITQTASDVTVALQSYAQDQVNNHAVEQQQYIRYSADGLELGESGTNAKAILDNTSLKFYSPADDVKAYIGVDELYDAQSNPLAQGSINSNTGGDSASEANRVRVSGLIKVSPSTEYVISCNIPQVYQYNFGSSQNYLSSYSGWQNTPYTFTTGANVYYIRMEFRYSDNRNFTPDAVTNVSIAPTSGDYKFFINNGHINNELELGGKWLLVASGSDNDNRLTFKWRG